MNDMLRDPVVLTSISVIVAVVYIAVLAGFGNAIAHRLQGIGAREPSTSNSGREQRSFLSRIWFGVRAIETEVAQLTPQATALNGNLTKLAGGLTAIKGSVTGILTAAQSQEKGGAHGHS